MTAHPRFVVVRYEDLVRSPDDVQRRLIRRMGFLRPVIPFSEYHQNPPDYITKSQQMQQAMRGIRAVSACNVGKWRVHLPRVKAQVEAHGCLGPRLIALGYEADETWGQALEGVVPDRQPGVVPGRISLVKAAWLRFRHLRTAGIYLFKRYILGRFHLETGKQRFLNLSARPDSDFATLSHRDASPQKLFANLDRGSENTRGPN
jgi:hypothetical protein